MLVVALGSVMLASANLKSEVGTTMMHLPKDVREGYFAGRSGDIVLKSENTRDDAMMMLFGKGAEKPTTGRASLYEVADVVAWTLGVQPMSKSFSASFLETDPFHMPKLDFVVAVESVGSADVNALAMPNMHRLSKKSTSVKLDSLPYPRDPVSLVSSAFMGQPPSVHGVVSAKYAEDARQVSSIADIVKSSFAQSKVVSISGSKAQALSLATAGPARSIAYLASGQFKGENVPAGLDLSWSLDQGLKNLKTSDLRYDANKKRIVVVLGNQRPVALSTENPAVRVLLSECLFAPVAAQRMQQSSFAKDGSPDLLSFTITGISKVREAFGAKSDEFKAALRVLDLTLPRVVSSMGSKDVAGQIVLLGSGASVSSARAASRELARLPRGSASLSAAHSIHLMDRQGDLPAKMVCENVASSVRESADKVLAYCPGLLSRQGSNVRFVEKKAHMKAQTATGAGELEVSDADVRKYHIVLWMSLFLAFWVAGASYVMAYMDFEKDNLIFDKPSIKDKGK